MVGPTTRSHQELYRAPPGRPQLVDVLGATLLILPDGIDAQFIDQVALESLFLRPS